MLMKVSHESPLCALDLSRTYNDFDYCLVHLCEQHPQYLDFFVNSRRVFNREVLLDNSIFELGTAFNPDRYMEFARQINPNMLIIPDVLEDAAGTVQSFVHFTHKYGSELSNYRTIGAVQGKTWNDIVECYKCMSQTAGPNMIAISFDFSYYQSTGTGVSKLERMMTGRQRLIHQLIDEGIWNWNKPHHLLGCSLAREFRYYVDNNIHNIVSCDTSNPIVAALHNLQYDADYGLQMKPSTKLTDLITSPISPDQYELIDYNTKQFKAIIRR